MRTNRRAQRGARELFRACVVNGQLDEARARHVAQSVAASRQRDALSLLTAFQRLVRLERDRRTAIVESAAPLGDALRASIVSRLHRVYGPSLAASFSENATLIGGVRIRVGSDVYDGSIRARLRALEAAL